MQEPLLPETGGSGDLYADISENMADGLLIRQLWELDGYYLGNEYNASMSISTNLWWNKII